MRIAWITPVPTDPADAGNRVRIVALADALRIMGHEVFCIHVQRWNGDEAAMRSRWGERLHVVPVRMPVRYGYGWKGVWRRVRRRLGDATPFTFGIDDWYDPSIDHALRRLQAQLHVDAVIVTYVFYSRAFDAFGPSVLKVLDAQDVFTDRAAHMRQLGEPVDFFSTTAKEERRGLARADVVLAIQEEEARILGGLTDRPVVTVGHLVDAAPAPFDPPAAPAVLFLGSRNPLNVEAVTYLREQIWPAVLQRHPAARLLIAGGICSALPDLDDCVKLGRIAAVVEAYDRARVVVCPILRGSGLKVKVIEALAHGRPVVATPHAAIGLESAQSGGLSVGGDPGAFADLVVDLLVDDTRWRNAARGAQAYAQTYRAMHVERLALALQSRAHDPDRG